MQSNTNPLTDGRRTHEKNATTHPGNALKEALCIHQPKEVIEKEKREKEIMQEERIQRSIADGKHQAAGKDYIKTLETNEDVAMAETEMVLPHWPVKGMNYLISGINQHIYILLKKGRANTHQAEQMQDAKQMRDMPHQQGVYETCFYTILS